MPPRKTFTKEMIIDAAFKIVKEQGWANISARTIAAALDSSTMPLYSYFRSMVEIEEELRKRTFDLLVDYQVASYTENPLMNMALGYIRFAREEKNLFRFFFIECSRETTMTDQEQMQQRVFETLGLENPLDDYFPGVPKEMRNTIITKTWIFTHGLAVLINSDTMKNLTNQEIEGLLQDNGAAVFLWESNFKKLSGQINETS